MRNGFLISLFSLVFAAGASAQDIPMPQVDQPTGTEQVKPVDPLPTNPQPGPGLTEVNPPGGIVGGAPTPVPGHPVPGHPDACWTECVQPQACCTNTCWGSIEYLRWWITDQPLPGPLATTGDPNIGALAGTLGQPSTVVLFGGPDVSYGSFSGARITFGGWINCDRTMGIEASGFLFGRETVHFSAASDNNGNPPIYVPAFNTSKGREDSLIVADTVQQFGGNLNISTTSRLWGAELNGICAGWSNCNCNVAFLGGIRYLDLQESLLIDNTTNDLQNDVTTTFQEGFRTRNRFYGPQVGARMGVRHDCWTLDVTGKLAIGSNRQLVDINGTITQFGTDAPTPGTFPGGFFTQPSNISRRNHDQFAVVPELQVKVGYDICCWARAFVGYDVLYLNQAVRPAPRLIATST